ncbi:DUF6088 family protein [Pantoea sp. A4]|uniref:DUF6088 family protein n=1 Tax=Pantoea sp. A4 TaxID=1225184 RepID=UPI00036BF5FC|nr:DUF6088 family protein [Pantoea sp. A4]
MRIKPLVDLEVSRFEPGQIFSYNDLPVFQENPSTTIKTVSRLVLDGSLRRFSKGLFYRPKLGLFGEVPLSDSEKIKTYLFRQGKRVGYITGTSLYNRLGLTTQVARTITIASDMSAQLKNHGTVEVRLIKARYEVTNENRACLEILDALADIRNIPDAEPAFVLNILADRIKEMAPFTCSLLVELARGYPPSVKALLGLLLGSKNICDVDGLKNELNPTTRYKIGLKGLWPEAKAWNIE